MGNLFARSARPVIFILSFVLLVSGCGGGNDSSQVNTISTPPLQTVGTGTVGILLTDAPIDALSAINIEVTEAILIGENGQQTVFRGNTIVDLLDLTDYYLPIAFGEVAAGSYSKIRLRINNVELVDKATGLSTHIKLPANGKIDLLDQGGFAVFPGRTLLATIDIDANKSIHIVDTGNGEYKFRPVVKVEILDGGLPDKLARLEGIATEIFDDPAGSFLLCDADNEDKCIVVNLAKGGSVFDAEGLPASFGKLMAGDPVVAIGRFGHENDEDGDSDSGDGRVDIDVVLNAIVIEIGGNATQVRGIAGSGPDDMGRFPIVTDKGDTVIAQLQDGTKIIDHGSDMPGPGSIVEGARIGAEGVIVKAEGEDDPNLLRAALIIVDDRPEGGMLAGSIVEPIDPEAKSFNLATDSGDRCVDVREEAHITLVSQGVDGAMSKMGEFADLTVGQSVKVYGEVAVGGCFGAHEVVVDLDTKLLE